MCFISYNMIKDRRWEHGLFRKAKSYRNDYLHRKEKWKVGKNFRETLSEQMKDPAFRAEWEAQEPERQIIRAMIEGRENQNMTQKDLASATGNRHRTSWYQQVRERNSESFSENPEASCLRYGDEAPNQFCSYGRSEHSMSRTFRAQAQWRGLFLDIIYRDSCLGSLWIYGGRSWVSTFFTAWSFSGYPYSSQYSSASS